MNEWTNGRSMLDYPNVLRVMRDHTCVNQGCGWPDQDVLSEEMIRPTPRAREVEGVVIQCQLCGIAQRIPSPHAKQDVFRMRAGRFAGLTLSEIAQQPRGDDYIQSLRQHELRVVREAAEAFLAPR
jgi:hypothetical protein